MYLCAYYLKNNYRFSSDGAKELKTKIDKKMGTRSGSNDD